MDSTRLVLDKVKTTTVALVFCPCPLLERLEQVIELQFGWSTCPFDASEDS